MNHTRLQTDKTVKFDMQDITKWSFVNQLNESINSFELLDFSAVHQTRKSIKFKQALFQAMNKVGPNLERG